MLTKWFGKKANDPGPVKAGTGATAQTSTKAVGDEAESQALRYLQQQSLTLVERNYRVAAGPNRRGAEVDLILRDRDGTLIFVEVRARSSRSHGGAADSVVHAKRQRIIYAAQHYLQTFASPPPCRFDVVLLEAGELQWLRAAFDAT